MLNFFCPLLGLNRIGKKNENFFFLCRKKLENSSIAFSKFVCFVQFCLLWFFFFFFFWLKISTLICKVKKLNAHIVLSCSLNFEQVLNVNFNEERKKKEEQFAPCIFFYVVFFLLSCIFCFLFSFRKLKKWKI